ncbi:MAG: tRNA uridine-5-carboxymethylaminomethyl(34) synthesis GTPase MnmE [bacterium]
MTVALPSTRSLAPFPIALQNPMNPLLSSDTIAAIATAEGAAGVAMVRISGAESWQVAERVVRCKGLRLADRGSGRFLHGYFVNPADGAIIDDGIVLLFRAPASFTGEDVVELQGHGGVALPRAVLRAVLSAGARLAEPGEFTRRAFLSGRLDLTQAEAVMDLVHARSERAALAARAQLAGLLGQEIDSLYRRLTALCADVEAQLDFEAGDLPARVLDEAAARLDQVITDVRRLLATSREGRLLRSGALVVIGGCPNAGKSSLLNALLGENRAIVSSTAGTTRDTIEEGVVLDGIPLRLVDTAGLRETTAHVEQEGVVRARQALEQADLVIYLIDASRPLAEQTTGFARNTAQILLVMNKMDLPVVVQEGEIMQAWQGVEHGIGSQAAGEHDLPPDVLKLSLKTGAGLPELKQALIEQLGVERQAPVHALVTERHRSELVRAEQAMLQGRALLADDEAHLVLVAGELRKATEALGRINGRCYTFDLLDQIFSRFCLGK